MMEKWWNETAADREDVALDNVDVDIDFAVG
jgi:hypothetical protein